MTPKVSVIIPVYGVEKYIERCARSLFEQTLDDIEYLFIDDCTQDKSIEILNNVLKKYPNRKNQVIVHRMEKNSGQALVRKWGILNATGDYVIHCDSDDWVDTDMYRAMYEKAVEVDAGVVVCDFVSTDGVDNSKDIVHIGCHDIDRDTFINNMLFQIDSWSLCNKLFKRTTYYIGDFRFPEEAMGEDMATVLQLILNCDKVVYMPSAYYHYQTNISSITHISDTQKIYARFIQAVDNADMVVAKYKKNGMFNMFADGFIQLKYRQKQLLFPLVRDKAYRRIWRNTYKEVNWEVVNFSNVRWQDKLKFYLALFGMCV